MNDILKIDGLGFGFGLRKQRVLDGLDLHLQDGAVTVLLGSNGAGKSTLLRVLLGVLRPQAGTVRVFGEDPLRSHKAVRRPLHKPKHEQQRIPCSSWNSSRRISRTTSLPGVALAASV